LFRFGNLRSSSGTCFLASLTDKALLAATASVRLAGVRLYPNPAHAQVAVQLPAGWAASSGRGAAVLTLFDAQGRAVRTQALRPTAATAVVPLTGLAPGLYRLRLQAGGQHASCRLIVE
jgi:hypothetical protein